MYRTDLAIERKEILDEEGERTEEIEGIELIKTDYGDGVTATTIDITTQSAADKLSKPIGKYITIEAKGMLDENEQVKMNAINAVADTLKEMIGFHYHLKVLVAGLGNADVTPDSLGPEAASKIRVTRHLFLIFDADGDDEMSCVSCIIPGVMGNTGIETAEIIKRTADAIDPEFIIVIDSLAARNIERVSTTIQITDTGISPGAGMGNRRTGISEETVGVKVIAIGIPTVIDVTTIIRDVLNDNIHFINHPDNLSDIDEYIEKYDQQMVVTSTDIDMIIKEFSDIIASGINKCLHPGIYK